MRKYIYPVLAISMLSACAVRDAANMSGTTVEELHACKDKACFLSLGSEVLETKPNPDGTTDTVYRAKKRTGHLGRAVLHGLLDVATLGIWEVIGTPIEGYVSDENSIVYKVTYDAAGNVAKVLVQGK